MRIENGYDIIKKAGLRGTLGQIESNWEDSGEEQSIGSPRF